MEQALAAGFLPCAARSDAAALLRTGAGSRAAAVAPARMARLPTPWSSASISTRGGATRSSSTVGNLTASCCSYSCEVHSSAAAAHLTVIHGSTRSSPAAGYLVTSCCACSCAAPSSSASPATGNLNISRLSPSSTARSPSSSGSALQTLVVSSSGSSSNPCYYSGASSRSAFSLQFASAASSSEAETLFARIFAFPCAPSSSSPPLCCPIFSECCLRVDIDASAAGRGGPRFFVIRQAISESEEGAAGSSAVESPLVRCYVVFSEGASSSAVFSAPSLAAAVFFPGADSPSPDAKPSSQYFNFLSVSSHRSCSCIPSPDLSRRTNYCILSGAAGSWRDKGKKRFDCRCHALSADGKKGKNREFVVRICFLCVLLQRSGCFDKLASHVDGKKSKINWQKMVKAALLLNCLMIGYTATAKGDKRMDLLIKVIDNTMKAYKIADEVIKLIFG